MTQAEQMSMYDDIDKGCKMIVDRIIIKAQSNMEMPLETVSCIVDIVKDISEIQKNISKVKYYMGGMPIKNHVSI